MRERCCLCIVCLLGQQLRVCSLQQLAGLGDGQADVGAAVDARLRRQVRVPSTTSGIATASASSEETEVRIGNLHATRAGLRLSLHFCRVNISAHHCLQLLPEDIFVHHLRWQLDSNVVGELQDANLHVYGQGVASGDTTVTVQVLFKADAVATVASF